MNSKLRHHGGTRYETFLRWFEVLSVKILMHSSNFYFLIFPNPRLFLKTTATVAIAVNTIVIVITDGNSGTVGEGEGVVTWKEFSILSKSDATTLYWEANAP